MTAATMTMLPRSWVHSSAALHRLVSRHGQSQGRQAGYARGAKGYFRAQQPIPKYLHVQLSLQSSKSTTEWNMPQNCSQLQPQSCSHYTTILEPTLLHSDALLEYCCLQQSQRTCYPHLVQTPRCLHTHRGRGPLPSYQKKGAPPARATCDYSSWRGQTIQRLRDPLIALRS